VPHIPSLDNVKTVSITFLSECSGIFFFLLLASLGQCLLLVVQVLLAQVQVEDESHGIEEIFTRD
jgi:hypothetical protein